MTRLPDKIRDVLHQNLSEEAKQKIWRGLVSRRRNFRPGRTRRVLRVITGATAIAALLLAVQLYRRRPIDRAYFGALHEAGGREVRSVFQSTQGTQEISVALDDGSRVVLAPGARVEVVANTGQEFVLFQRTGRAEFEVRPGGGRRWVVECGLATVEVIGTRFSVDRTPSRVRVEVSRGIVMLRGDLVPERVQRLAAHQSIVIVAPAVAQHVVAPPPLAPPTVVAQAPVSPRSQPASPSSLSVVRAADGNPRPTAWQHLARRGSFHEAYDALGPAGIAVEARDATRDTLFTLVDVARLSGHPAEAVLPLRRLLRTHRADAHAPLAAFTLGRIQLDALARPSEAADAFADAIALGIRGGLLEDAHARLVEAHARSGNRAAALVAASEYQRRFPDGRHASAVRRWTGATR